MKTLIFVLFFLTTLFANANDKFGNPISNKKPITLEEAVKTLDRSNNQSVLVEAKVEKVCKSKGCWMALTSKDGEVRVTFKDYSFFVPISLIGKTVFVEGQLEKKKMSLSETKHYVKDEGGDPSKVTEARSEIRIVATGVEVKKTK